MPFDFLLTFSFYENKWENNVNWHSLVNSTDTQWMVCYLFNEEGFISYGNNTPHWLSEILNKSTTNPHMPYMKINLHVNWTLISCYKQQVYPKIVWIQVRRCRCCSICCCCFKETGLGPLLLIKSKHLSRGVGLRMHMKGVGMLVVSLRGVDFGFWSHLGCSGQNTIIFSREGLV